MGSPSCHSRNLAKLLLLPVMGGCDIKRWYSIGIPDIQNYLIGYFTVKHMFCFVTGFYSLERRRMRDNLMEVYKIMRGIDRVNAEYFTQHRGIKKNRR